ncbi:hypothetical protein M513_10099 [Trichuris suis]|uniref:DNA-dependent protein kinase catalytic subunit CC1/2 domain-containing protein n=1 Tax=Trichuris suis TaxID=68888 RepID=A0A085LVQ5_9BILA|nr:hypothetical protein M513_10099 [Trichuris suis]
MSETGRIIHGYALLKKMDKLPAGLISNCDNVWELLMSSCFGRQAVLLYSTELLSARVRFAKQILCIVPITTAQVKSLVHILADCQLVKLFNFSPVETKGNEAFASLFETEIATLFCHNSATFLEQAIYAFEGNDEGFIQLLCSLLNCIVHSSNLRKRCGSRIVENIVSPCISKMSLWSDVSISSEQVKLLWVKFVMKLLLIDSKVVNWPCSDVIYRCYFKLLNDQSVSLGFKNQMLTLLAAFCTSEKEKDNIESELKLFIVNNFPLNSSEFEPDTAKFKEYITTCERFCDAFANTGCLVILDLLLMVVCREEKHPVISYLHGAFRYFVRRFSRVDILREVSLPALNNVEDAIPVAAELAVVITDGYRSFIEREDNNHRDNELKQSDLLQTGHISQTGGGHSQIAVRVVLSEGHVRPTTSTCRCHQRGPRPAASAGTIPELGFIFFSRMEMLT